jgi:hypothetical protein
LSALSGILGVPSRVLIAWVFVSALVFLPFPADPIPWVLLGLSLLVIGYLEYEHGIKPKEWNRHAEEHR